MKKLDINQLSVRHLSSSVQQCLWVCQPEVWELMLCFRTRPVPIASSLDLHIDHNAGFLACMSPLSL